MKMSDWDVALIYVDPSLTRSQILLAFGLAVVIVILIVSIASWLERRRKRKDHQ